MPSNQNRVFDIFTSARHTRRVRSVDRRRRRSANRIYERRVQPLVSVNNEDTLNRITNLPTQITNNLLTYEFFNGSPFI